MGKAEERMGSRREREWEAVIMSWGPRPLCGLASSPTAPDVTRFSFAWAPISRYLTHLHESLIQSKSRAKMLFIKKLIGFF